MFEINFYNAVKFLGVTAKLCLPFQRLRDYTTKQLCSFVMKLSFKVAIWLFIVMMIKCNHILILVIKIKRFWWKFLKFSKNLPKMSEL